MQYFRTSETDEALVIKYLAGDTQALDELVLRNYKQIFFFSKTFVKNDDAAEDATQETFVKVWKNLKKFDPQKKFKTWLFQIAKNTCIDHIRKTKTAPSAREIDAEQALNELEKIVDPTPLPEQIFDALGFEKNLEHALNILPENYKLVATLHLQQSLTFDEIAGILKEPINTVKSRYRRALLLIRKKLN